MLACQELDMLLLIVVWLPLVHRHTLKRAHPLTDAYKFTVEQQMHTHSKHLSCGKAITGFRGGFTSPEQIPMHF